MLNHYERVFFERDAMEYPLGKLIYEKLKKEGVSIEWLKSHNRVTGIPGKTSRESFFHGKNTLVVGLRHTFNFASCKPSAHFQLPLVTGCEGICEYCYLNTQLGKKPYTRIYVNIDEILAQAHGLIEQRKPEVTLFEAAATSDPLPVEMYSRSLATAIRFFAGEEYGRLRFVTKFTNVDSLLEVHHKEHTRIRFSINTHSIIKIYEHRTPSLADRLSALSKVLQHGYPSGVIIAPVIMTGEWERDYEKMLHELRQSIPENHDKQLEFEVISHRFTSRAKNTILDVFPNTALPMDETHDRKFKYGQFGYGKYVYSPELLKEMKDYFKHHITQLFPSANINYII
jgi:spore photoproduct lyase